MFIISSIAVHVLSPALSTYCRLLMSDDPSDAAILSLPIATAALSSTSSLSPEDNAQSLPIATDPKAAIAPLVIPSIQIDAIGATAMVDNTDESVNFNQLCEEKVISKSIHDITKDETVKEVAGEEPDIILSVKSSSLGRELQAVPVAPPRRKRKNKVGNTDGWNASFGGSFKV